MSATQLAGLIVVCVVAFAVVALATWVVWKMRPRFNVNEGPAWLAIGLGLFALVVFGVGIAVTTRDPNTPPTSTVHGCQEGTYDNGSNGDGPKCLPWPVGSGR